MLRVGAGKANIDPYDDMYPMATHFEYAMESTILVFVEQSLLIIIKGN